MTTFGARLTDLRKQRKLSQRDLAKILNKAYSAIGKYERGETIPSIEMVQTIAEKLDVPMTYFIDDSDGYKIIKNKEMVKRLLQLDSLQEEDKQHIIFTFDAMLRDAKARQAYK